METQCVCVCVYVLDSMHIIYVILELEWSL